VATDLLSSRSLADGHTEPASWRRGSRGDTFTAAVARFLPLADIERRRSALKSLLAVVLGLGIIGLGAWRMWHGQATPGLIAIGIGTFLLLRGITRTVRRGL